MLTLLNFFWGKKKSLDFYFTSASHSQIDSLLKHSFIIYMLKWAQTIFPMKTVAVKVVGKSMLTLRKNYLLTKNIIIIKYFIYKKDEMLQSRWTFFWTIPENTASNFLPNFQSFNIFR